ncbi:efflux RND transporter permease subunit [Bacillus sp. 2205SS5-2]|uniref:efflux RND transporter permease subunit n=1 Tax=Bacillus sp. 2205SS5-2 TaxID=3109031 RepID=UPI003005ACDA
MKFLRFIVNRKILVGLLVSFVLALGGYAIFQLDKELFPPLDFDGAYVSVTAGEMPAIEVERNITTPLEQQILSMNGVEDVNSTSSIGRSSLNVTFERGKGEELSKEVERIANTALNTPGVQDVFSDQYSTTQSYEFYMDLSDGDMAEMTTFAKGTLKPRLEALPEVGDVMLSGIQEQELAIEFDRDKVIQKGVSLQQAISAITEANTAATLGKLSGEDNTPTLRWNTTLENVENIKAVKIPTPTGYLAIEDIATVSLQPLENSSFVWKNGSKDLIFIQVGRGSNYTQIDMANAVRAELQSIRDENLITGFEMNEMVALADYVQESLDGVTNNIIIGGVIAIVILMLFLRNLRATLIIGLSIPTSILLTFLTMWLLNYSFNILTLVGLGLGVGMMVDSSIVILESIYHKKEQGFSKLEAVIKGTKEVASAVFASMLTTIVVFVPIGLLGGEMGRFMIMLSVVVAITLTSSVIVSFTLIPSLSENFLKLRKKTVNRKESNFTTGYSKMISWVVKKKRSSFAVVTLFFLFFVGSLLLITKIPMTIMPDMFNRYAEIAVSVETGVSVADKEKIITEMTESLSKVEDVDTAYIMDEGSMLYTIINMTKGEDITKEQQEVNEDIFRSLRALEDTTPIESVASAMTGGGGSPVQVTIQGEKFADLQTLAADFQSELEAITGIVGVTTSIERTSIEEVITLKEGPIQEAGLTSTQIKQFIEQAFIDMPVGSISIENETTPIKVRWKEKTDETSEVLNLMIPTLNGEKLLSSFIELSSIDTPNEISHKNGERFISISADIEDTDLGTVNRKVQNLISDFETPSGYSISVAGDLEAQQELIMEMLMILAISIFLVYLVMAVQFNHLIHPVVVMSVIPMTIVGVILGLFITQRELSVMSGMGVIMLIGIVLNNAILLIDRTNQLRNQGLSVQDALVGAGKDRIRPIFMTTFTTAGGMVPLALASGSSGNYQAPMATVIISGLLFATFITLLLVPAVYRLFSSLGVGISQVGRSKKKEKNSESSTPSVPEVI